MEIRGRGFRLSPRKQSWLQSWSIRMEWSLGWDDEGTEQAWWAAAEGIPAVGKRMNQIPSRAHCQYFFIVGGLLLGLYYKRQVTPTDCIFKHVEKTKSL